MATSRPRPLAPAPELRRFLDAHFIAPGDLAAAPDLAASLRRECQELEASIRGVEAQLAAAAASWLARSGEASSALRRVRSHGGGVDAKGEGGKKAQSVELLALVREIERIDTIRLYAEATLQLEALVGNLEDATFAIVRDASKQNLSFRLQRASTPNEMEWKQEKLHHAVNALKDIEQELLRISTCGPKWTNLGMAVDNRVDKTLAVLRPQAVTNHRALLAALGWPPSLSTPDTEKDKHFQIPNPLLLMNGVKKEKYSQSFLALCALQHVQASREVRRLQSSVVISALSDSKYIDKTACFDNGLWAIDELVHPIASRMEYHFAKWSEQPEFIFALVYKITKDFMDGVDDVLQPLIDQARLVGLSAKESWVTGMVKMLLGYLETQIFPTLVTSYQATNEKTEVLYSWLHLIDLMITFDKRMHLLASSGIQKIASMSEGFSRSLSIFSIYGEHSDWLQIWADVELSFARHKFNSEMEDETCWIFSTGHDDKLAHQENTITFLFSTREDYKAPPVSELVVKTASAMIERGRALPDKGMQIRYTRSSAVQFLNHFFLFLLERCEGLQLSSTASEHESLLKASYAINAARYCESVLQEWEEDIIFLEMGAHENNGEHQKQKHKHNGEHQWSFFSSEIAFLVKLETDYLEQILSSILLEFEDLSWDYVQNIGSSEEQTELDDQVMDEENLGVSPRFIAALDLLTERTTKLKLYLNSKDFLDLWRSIAEGLDYFIYSSIRWGEVNFSKSAILQLKADTRALLHVFRPLCARPEAFFPFLSDSLKLLIMRSGDANYLMEMLKNDEKNDSCLRRQGLHHVNACQAAKILRSRRYGG